VAAGEGVDRIELGITLQPVVAADTSASAEMKTCEVLWEPSCGFDIEWADFFIAVPGMERQPFYSSSKSAEGQRRIPVGVSPRWDRDVAYASTKLKQAAASFAAHSS
jgi:hypothetical protein